MTNSGKKQPTENTTKNQMENSQYNRESLIARFVLAMVVCVIYLAMHLIHQQMSRTADAFDRHEGELTFNHLTNQELVNELQYQQAHENDADSLELALKIGWVLVPILVILIFVIKFPEVPNAQLNKTKSFT